MVSGAAMRRALGRLSLLKYFPVSQPEAIRAVAEMLSELCASDADVEKVVSTLLHDPTATEWPGAGEFFERAKYTLYDYGMIKRGGKWVPHPENGPRYDIVADDGSRHWIDGAFYVYPQRPYKRTSSDDAVVQ